MIIVDMITVGMIGIQTMEVVVGATLVIGGTPEKEAIIGTDQERGPIVIIEETEIGIETAVD